MKRRWIAAVVAVLVLVLVVALANSHASQPVAASTTESPAAETSGTPSAEGEGKGGNPEAAEQDETTDTRLEAVEEARANGTLGVDTSALQSSPAAGWAGEHVVDRRADDWEPAIATDPSSPWVYLVTTRYAPKPCKGKCPSPWMALTISKDGGSTWGPQVPLCACKGRGQFDPQIEVVPGNGDVYAAYMNGFHVVFIRSTDHGKTWSAPVKVYGNVAWTDKPLLVTSDDGRNVYISFNGPRGGDAWVTQSHDGGRTWTQTRVTKSHHYYYAFGGVVTPTGRVVFAESAVDYANNVELTGTTKVFAIVSSDRGRTWKRVLVDAFPVGLQSPERADFYAGHTALASDDDGNLVFAYDAPTTPYGIQRIYTRRSTDGGLTWSARTPVSLNGEMATAPALTAHDDGDVRMFYFQTAGGGNLDKWNVWYRASSDGGRSWSGPVKISDASGGASYKTAAGFGEPYGDYGEMGITSHGETIAAWGEGTSYAGPGGVWVNRQT